ncbi:hypothetical protein JAAARDRAFT_73160 [Jaapia argillacea MUCL 33604]|uniref:Uncharacterized protein n=1 Tax=Jaapia argillacea MUCL 33604 TaxID=933084 RepID=A0A067PEE1_9AGAM|nr:hypothetical protein JAAARDRAFT_73160 [Jaapia argillacea MUCL 33604]
MPAWQVVSTVQPSDLRTQGASCVCLRLTRAIALLFPCRTCRHYMATLQTPLQVPPELLFHIVAEVITEALVEFVLSYELSPDQFPSKSIGPLLQVSHDFRESALQYLSLGLGIGRDADGSFNHNPWLSVKEVRDLYWMSSATPPTADVVAYHESHADELLRKPLALSYFRLGLARCMRITCLSLSDDEKAPEDLILSYLDVLSEIPEVPSPSWGWVVRDWMLPALFNEMEDCKTVLHFSLVVVTLEQCCETWENFGDDEDSECLEEQMQTALTLLEDTFEDCDSQTLNGPIFEESGILAALRTAADTNIVINGTRFTDKLQQYIDQWAPLGSSNPATGIAAM